MKNTTIHSTLSETLKQLLATAKTTSTAWAQFIGKNPLAERAKQGTENFILEIKKRYPQYSEFVTQLIEGQKTAFRELRNTSGPLPSQGSELEKTETSVPS